MFMRPEWVPVDRLVGNTARYVAAHPSEASAHYALGRLHYLAFTLKMDLVPAFPHRDDELARPVPTISWGCLLPARVSNGRWNSHVRKLV
jgi:hypothetical protein